MDDITQENRKIAIIIERIIPDELSRYSNHKDALDRIVNLNVAYLSPQTTPQYIVLHPKEGAPDIGLYSIFGQNIFL